MKFTADTSQWIVTECRIGNSWTPKVQWQPSDLQAQHVCFFNTHSFSKPHFVSQPCSPNGHRTGTQRERRLQWQKKTIWKWKDFGEVCDFATILQQKFTNQRRAPP